MPANGRATRNSHGAVAATANKSGGLIVIGDQPITARRGLTANTSKSPAPTTTAPVTLVIHN